MLFTNKRQASGNGNFFELGNNYFVFKGYNDWKNASRSVINHETSDNHIQASQNLTIVLSEAVIDCQFDEECEKKSIWKFYWTGLLVRLNSLVKEDKHSGEK